MRKIVYAGTFDPVTLGHLDIIHRCLKITGQVVVAVSDHSSQRTWFSADERVAMFHEATTDLEHVTVDRFRGLLVDYVQSIGANLIVRGLRFISDFEHELQMALMNRRLNGEIETMLLAPSEEYAFINATLIREIIMAGGNVNGLVPPCVAAVLHDKQQQWIQEGKICHTR